MTVLHYYVTSSVMSLMLFWANFLAAHEAVLDYGRHTSQLLETAETLFVYSNVTLKLLIQLTVLLLRNSVTAG